MASGSSSFQNIFGHSNQGAQIGVNNGSIQNSFHHVPEQANPPPKPYAIIPFSIDPDFIPRGDVIERMTDKCSRSPYRVALFGLGGVGKTQIANEYAHRAKLKAPESWLFWIHASTLSRVNQGFKEIADAAKLPGRHDPSCNIPKLVYDWLSNAHESGQWTLIIDSADDDDVFCQSAVGSDGRPMKDYLPQSANGCIIVTTRSRTLANILAGRQQDTIEIRPMDQESALKLLNARLRETNSDEQAAIDLVEVLGRIPLAISQAGAYISSESPLISIRDYLEAINRAGDQVDTILAQDLPELRRDGSTPSAVFKTWKVSYDHIKRTQSSAADLLSLMSFFDHQGISLDLLSPPYQIKTARVHLLWLVIGNAYTKYERCNRGHGLSTILQSDIRMLRRYCLISINESGQTFEMHRLVQIATRTWLHKEGRASFVRRFVFGLNLQFPRSFDEKFEIWPRCQSLLPHALLAATCFNDATERYPSVVEAWGELMDHVVNFIGCWMGKGQTVLKLAIDAEEICMQTLGQYHRVTLRFSLHVAYFLHSSGKYESAVKRIARTLPIFKRVFGNKDTTTLAGTRLLALAYQQLGRLDEAAGLLESTVMTKRRMPGNELPAMLTCMWVLSSVYQEQGRLQDAENLNNQVMESRKRVLGEEHPEMLVSLYSLGQVFRAQGRLQDAEQLFDQVIRVSKRVLGDEHPNTLVSTLPLGQVYRAQGRLQDAEQLFDQVIKVSKRVLGDEHPKTLAFMHPLGQVYRAQGRLEDAEQLWHRLVELQCKVLGIKNYATLNSMNELGSVYQAQGRLEEAEQQFISGLDTRRKIFTERHPETLIAMHDLAFCWYEMGRHEEALVLIQECVQQRRVAYGEQDQRFQNSASILAKLQEEQNGTSTSDEGT